MVAFDGGPGSPSLMTIMCLTAGGCGSVIKPAKPCSARSMPGSKSGMSPGVIRSTAPKRPLRYWPISTGPDL